MRQILYGASEFADLRLEPGRFAIFEDNAEAPTLDMNMATAEIYARLRETVEEATRGAIATDDGEGHG